MRAIRFSIGFPPLIARRQIGDTEYALGAIPLGGYVKIPGMNRPEAERPVGGRRPARPLRRACPQADASAIGIVYDEASRTSPRAGSTPPRCTCAELGALVAAAEPHLTRAESKRLEKMFERVQQARRPEGVLAVQQHAPADRDPGRAVHEPGRRVPDPDVRRGHRQAAAGGAGARRGGRDRATRRPVAAGLKAGDRIVAVNGTPVRSFTDVRSAIEGMRRRPQITIVVRRDGKQVELPPERPYRQDGRWLYGFQPRRPLPHDVGAAGARRPGDAASQLWSMTSGTFSALANMGSSSGRGQVSSTVGIVRYSADVARHRRGLLPDGDRADLALAGHLQPAAAAAAGRRARAVHRDRAAARPADLARRVRAGLGRRHRADPGAVRDRPAERPERDHRAPAPTP